MDIEDLEVLKIVENLADRIWRDVVAWQHFAKDTIGKQLARSVDSIGAYIAEGFGRYHFGDKLKFFYYARGSVFETKYWLNRAAQRQLLKSEEVEAYLADLTQLAKRLNTLVAVTKRQQSGPKGIKESAEAYATKLDLFSPSDLDFLAQPETTTQ